MESSDVVATLCGVITALRALSQWWYKFLTERTAEGVQQDGTMDVLHSAFVRMWSKYNRAASLMGLKFQSSLNETAANDLKLLVPKLKTLQEGLTTLKMSEESSLKVQLAQGRLSYRVAVLALYARDVQVGTENLLEKVFPGAFSDIDVSKTDVGPLETIDPPRQFCNGAKLFQAGDKTDRQLFSIAARSFSSSTWGYICAHCGLEVGLYPAVRISGSQKALDSSILLTASHLVAFKSVKLRRAFYRCLPCYKERKIVDFPSASSFERHMEEHPDFTLMNEQDENTKLKDIEMRQKAFMAGIEAATDNPEGLEGIELEDTASEQITKVKDVEKTDRNTHRKVETDVKDSYQQDNSCSNALKDFPHQSRHVEPHGRDKILEIRRKETKKNSAAPGLPGKSQARNIVDEVGPTIPETFPFGIIGSTTPTSTISSLLDLSVVDVARSSSTSTGAMTNDAANELETYSVMPPKHSTTKGSTVLYMSDVDEASADLPIGLVERASEPRSGVMSPAPADPLARVSLPVVPRRPDTRSEGKNNSSDYAAPFESKITGPFKHQSHQTGSIGKSETSTASERRASTVSTSAANSIGKDHPGQPQNPQISPPRRDPPLPPREEIENVSNQIISLPTARPIEKTSKHGTWELLPNDMFTFFSAGGKIIWEQKDPPKNEWIWSKTGWREQAGMYWAKIQSRSNEVIFAAEDPR